jgi:hypothetical protein
MRTLGFWFLWTLLSGLFAAMVWRKIRHHIKVYLLILINGLYLSGIFIIYGLLQDVFMQK